MLPASHLLLGRILAKKTPALSRHPIRKGAFLIGNIAPDFVPHTFFQESRQQFDAVPPSTERDAEWIVRACSAVFLKIASI